MATHRCDAEYWVANLRHPVRFAQAVAAASATHTTFIEISPHPLLTFAISDTLGDTHHHALGTLARDTHDTVSFHTALNTTHTTHPPDTEHPPGPHPQLPTTPWYHSHHWITTAVTAPVGVNHRGVDGGCVQAAGVGAARPLLEMVLVRGTGGMCRGGYRVQERLLMACRVANGWCSLMPRWVPSWAGAWMAGYGCIRRGSSMVIWMRSGLLSSVVCSGYCLRPPSPALRSMWRRLTGCFTR